MSQFRKGLIFADNRQHISQENMASTPQTEIFTGTRITVHSHHDFNTTMSRLYSEIGSPSEAKWPEIAKGITSFDEASKQAFISKVEDAVGSKGFMIFLVRCPSPFF